MNLTEIAVANYLTALGADSYELRFVHAETKAAIKTEYTTEIFGEPKTIKHLRLKNREGFHIYARPVGWQYVLLDDLTRPALADLAPLRPCALIETSPDNYQAWLILPDVPPDRDAAKVICGQLAKRFGADPGSAEPDHVGRVPGYTNRKPKHRQANGQFPYVKLWKWAHRLSTFYPSGGIVPNNPSISPSLPKLPVADPIYQRWSGHDHSRHDFGILLGLALKGRTDQQLSDHLWQYSPDLEARKGGRKGAERYIAHTISAVRQHIARY